MRYNKVYFLCRCTKREFAKKMLDEGELYFNNPINWIKEDENGNEGQGDRYEGVYTDIITDRMRRLRPDVEVVEIEGKRYLRSRSVINDWLCMSFFGATQLTEHEEDEGKLIYEVTKDYVVSFSGGETFESMLGKPLNERLSMIVINKTGSFMNRIRDCLNNEGLTEEKDYFMHHVVYRIKGRQFWCERMPTELYSKDARFCNQNEFRIVLNPKSAKVKEILKEGHKIYVGSLKGIISLRRPVYEGTVIKIDDSNHRVEGGDWPTWWGPLQEWCLQPMIEVMKIAGRRMHFKLNDDIVDSYRFWIEMTYVLATKYNIEITQQGYGDERDEEVTLWFHSDDLKTIVDNEHSDCYYYLNDSTYKAPMVNALMGESGTVKMNYMVKKS